ncbi:hypothetical protein [Janthinobacterium sp. BJB401]|uniref:hypothetical protein n=1 Tax=Janthinobacterium sp. BJB401 TaxID=2745934 RepID=UPI0015955790|nr:hypothetical protein [Janthinobacterium sp. BJB401]NVI84058.1 hypothetical protein [Janthinobacterium sp. BJB401]
MTQKTLFEEILNEAAAFKSRLTTESNLDLLESALHASIAPFDVGCPESLDSRCVGIGLYYLEAKFPFSRYTELEDFGDRWGRIRAKDVPPAMPRYYPQRAKMHKEKLTNGEYLPFYLGKRLDIKDRLKGHIIGGGESKTYSLKLQSRPEIIKGIDFRFGFLPIPVHEHGYFCVALLEHAIRDRINPIIGKQ